jgi:hypothetical protein
MKYKWLFRGLNRPVHPVISAIALFGILLFGGILIIGTDRAFRSHTLYISPTIRTVPINSPTPNLHTSFTSTPTQPLYTSYTSPNLGIRFNYQNVLGGDQRIYVKEIGNKVYLYNTVSNQPFSGPYSEFLKTIAQHAKFVAVFHKESRQSLQDAIKQEFLSGYSEDNCFVNKPRPFGPREDDSLVTVIIDVPRIPDMTNEQFHSAAAKCPAYVSGFEFGVRYFMMDPKHPNKFFYFELGQDNIPSGIKEYSWDGTIKVLQ